MSSQHRRQFLHTVGRSGAFALASTWFLTPGAFADELELTPTIGEGPFYPDKLPLDTDNDLLVLNDNITPAVGQITHLTGKVLSQAGEPIRNAVVEIWQADNNGAYIHSRSMNADKRDANFQGFGRFLTNAKGEYYFRTIKPVPYTGRTPHIHVAVNKGSERLLTTQCFVKGAARNEQDGLLRRLKSRGGEDSVVLDFKPLEGSKLNELTANFNMVIGVTPDDETHA